MEQDFEVIVDAADLRFVVRGKTLRDLFRNGLRAVASCVKPDVFKVAKRERGGKHVICVQAVDLNSLFVEFLSETIAKSDMHNSVFCDISFKKFGENFLEGKLVGINAEGGFDRDIKAVSLEGVDIKKNPNTGFYETNLILEI